VAWSRLVWVRTALANTLMGPWASYKARRFLIDSVGFSSMESINVQGHRVAVSRVVIMMRNSEVVSQKN
jgi:hypothetical protein